MLLEKAFVPLLPATLHTDQLLLSGIYFYHITKITLLLSALSSGYVLAGEVWLVLHFLRLLFYIKRRLIIMTSLKMSWCSKRTFSSPNLRYLRLLLLLCPVFVLFIFFFSSVIFPSGEVCWVTALEPAGSHLQPALPHSYSECPLGRAAAKGAASRRKVRCFLQVQDWLPPLPGLGRGTRGIQHRERNSKWALCQVKNYKGQVINSLLSNKRQWRMLVYNLIWHRNDVIYSVILHDI